MPMNILKAISEKDIKVDDNVDKRLSKRKPSKKCLLLKSLKIENL